MNNLITIQRKTTIKGSAGGVTETWEGFAQEWAGIRNPSGNERRLTERGGEIAEARTEFKIHYRGDIDETRRVSYNGKIYNIKHVNNLNEANTWLILTCDTGANDG